MFVSFYILLAVVKHFFEFQKAIKIFEFKAPLMLSISYN